MAIYNLSNDNQETKETRHNGGELQAIISGNFAGAIVRLKVWNSEEDKVVLTKDDFYVTKKDIFRVAVQSGSKYSFFIENSTVNTAIRIYTN